MPVMELFRGGLTEFAISLDVGSHPDQALLARPAITATRICGPSQAPQALGTAVE